MSGLGNLAIAALLLAPVTAAVAVPVSDVPNVTITSLTAGFVQTFAGPDAKASRWMGGKAFTAVRLHLISPGDRVAGFLYLEADVAACPVQDGVNVAGTLGEDLLLTGSALAQTGGAVAWDSSDDTEICHVLGGNPYDIQPQAWQVPLRMPANLRSQTRPVVVSLLPGGAGPSIAIGTFLIHYAIRRTDRATSRTIWQGTDGFYNVCIKDSLNTWSKGGRLYCVDTTPAYYRVDLSVVSPNVLGG
ncbi:MAG: hypothetical protein WCI83_03830 [Thermoleophilia bacterium]